MDEWLRAGTGALAAARSVSQPRPATVTIATSPAATRLALTFPPTTSSAWPGLPPSRAMAWTLQVTQRRVQT
jgi:hypothetical protein